MDKIKNFFTNCKEIFKGKDDYLLDTYEDIDKKIKSKAYKKVGIWIAVIPIVLIVGVILFKALPAIIELKLKENKVVTTEKEKKNTEIAFSEDEMWKLQSEERQKEQESKLEKLNDDVSNIETLIKTSVNEINENIKTSNKENKENLTSLKKEIFQEIENTNEKIKNIKSENDVELEELKKELNNGKYSKESSLKKLDPNKLVLLNPEKPNFENQSNVNKRVESIMGKIDEEVIEEDEVEYEYVEVSYEDGSNINTLEYEIDDDEENDTPKEFYLSGGFVKATLLTGGDYHTMSEGDKETIPVTLSIDSKLVTPNNEKYDLRDCFVTGPAKADFTTKTAYITVSNIQCHLTDDEGKKYAINETIEGWVFDENGEYGAEGRLITKEGEIIAKALPLAILQTGMEVLTNRSQQNTGADGVVSFSGASVASNAGQTIMDKIGDKWLKYIDGLNPKVNLRPGRELIVQFKGGNKLKIEEIEPADLGNFRKSIEGSDYEE